MGQCKSLVWPLSSVGVPCPTVQGFGECNQKAKFFSAPANPPLLQGRSQQDSVGGKFPPVLSVIIIDLKLASICLNTGRKFYSDFLVSLLPNLT